MRVVLPACLLALATATTPSLAAAQARVPTWQVGDEWTYRWESPRGKGVFTWVVTRVETVGGVECYVTKSGGREVYWRKSDLGFHSQTLDGILEERATPPRPDYLWPLTPGATWEHTYTRERPTDRQTEEFTITARVEGEETVRVPAGTFRALKVVRRNKRSGALASETWFAPEVRSWVRQRIQYPYGIMERELVAYKPRDATPAAAPSPPPAAPPPATAAPAPPTPAPKPQPGLARGEFTHRVTYRVTGTATEARITYRNERGGTQQTAARVPWELNLEARAGNFLYVSAQNQGASGSVGCDILVDGVVRTTATSTGAYVVAECSEAGDP